MDETVIKRVMPHNGEAEEAVIGSMLLDQDAVVLASEKLNEDDFYNARYRILFSAIVELFHEGRPADLVTLVDTLPMIFAVLSFSVISFPPFLHQPMSATMRILLNRNHNCAR